MTNWQPKNLTSPFITLSDRFQHFQILNWILQYEFLIWEALEKTRHRISFCYVKSRHRLSFHYVKVDIGYHSVMWKLDIGYHSVMWKSHLGYHFVLLHNEMITYVEFFWTDRAEKVEELESWNFKRSFVIFLSTNHVNILKTAIEYFPSYSKKTCILFFWRPILKIRKST